MPKTNPFLRTLFQRIAVFDLDPRRVWIVEEFTNREEKLSIYSLHLEIALRAIYAGVKWQAA